MADSTSVVAWLGFGLGIANAIIAWRKHWWDTDARLETKKRREWCEGMLGQLREEQEKHRGSTISLPVPDEQRAWAVWGETEGRYFYTYRRPTDGTLFARLEPVREG